MPRKKKTETTIEEEKKVEVTEAEEKKVKKKSTKKVVKDKKVKEKKVEEEPITSATPIENGQAEETDNVEEKTEKVKVHKGHKHFDDMGSFWMADRIILRLDGEDDIIRKFASGDIMVNKDKIGKKTKIGEDRWAKIVEVDDKGKDIVFVLEEIQLS
jgi:hypothetical protein